jgi:hypothetical protein
MTEYVRVTDEVKPRREYTISQRLLDARPGVFKVLDKPATYPSGEPLPPKHLTTVSAEAAKDKAAIPVSKTSASNGANEKAGSTATDKEI